MDNDAQQAVVYLFFFMLPGSAYCWGLALLAAGFLRDPADRRRIFPLAPLNNILQFVAKSAGSMPSGRNTPLLTVAVVGIAFFNAVPVLVLVRNPFGIGTLLVVLAYFLIHGIWLLALKRGITRTGSGHSGG
jgi:hypothetical protein